MAADRAVTHHNCYAEKIDCYSGRVKARSVCYPQVLAVTFDDLLILALQHALRLAYARRLARQ
jgi:hypothetical protein